MVKVEDKLGEFTGGFFRIEIDDKDVKGDKIEFELRPTQKHKRKLLFNYKQIQELTQLHEKTVNDHKVTDEYDKRHNDTSERLHTDQNDFVTDILKTSYPDFNVEQVEGIMMRYDTELLSELYMAWGWIDKDVIEAMKKRKLEELKKLSGAVENPLENKPLKSELEKSENN